MDDPAPCADGYFISPPDFGRGTGVFGWLRECSSYPVRLLWGDHRFSIQLNIPAPEWWQLNQTLASSPRRYIADNTDYLERDTPFPSTPEFDTKCTALKYEQKLNTPSALGAMKLDSLRGRGFFV